MVLMSIHPEHVSSILSGDKIFEYRKILPKDNVSYLAIYATNPVKKIVAVAEVGGYLSHSPTKLWKLTSFGSGITRDFFRKYFKDRRRASAIIIKSVNELIEPISLSELSGLNAPPQSYYYLDNSNKAKVLSKRKAFTSHDHGVIFVGGVHGVGKSTICEQVFSYAGYHCFTASELIRSEKNATDKKKIVNNVNENQRILITALKNESNKGSQLVLDGHFTLVGEDNRIVPIDVDVFLSMNIKKLILVKAKVEDIVRRLKGRDNFEWEPSFVEKFQKSEELHARHVAGELGIPLRIVRV